MMMGFDGISTTDMVEDSDSSIVSGAGPHTIDNVTCAGACFVAACIATNRTPTITSGEDVRIAAWTPTGADGFTYVCVTERLSGAGSADVTVSLDVSGFVWGNIWAMNEAAAGGGVPPGIFNNPRRGGGVDLLVRLLEGRYRFPFGPRLVSNKVWVRR
jgi:hypothetical protein